MQNEGGLASTGAGLPPTTSNTTIAAEAATDITAATPTTMGTTDTTGKTTTTAIPAEAATAITTVNPTTMGTTDTISDTTTAIIAAEAATTVTTTTTTTTRLPTTKPSRQTIHRVKREHQKRIDRLNELGEMIDILSERRSKLRVTQTKQQSIRRMIAVKELELAALEKKIGNHNVEKSLQRASGGLRKFRFEQRKILMEVKEKEKTLKAMKVVPEEGWLWKPTPASVRMAEW